MPRTVTIKVPSATKSGKVDYYEVTGQPVWLDVAGVKTRFLLQQGGKLTHYASGFIMADLAARRLMLMVSLGPSNIPTDRRIAQSLVDEIIAHHGIDKVRAQLALHPVINP